VYVALCGKKIFASAPTKIAEFEMKNRRKSAEEAKAELCCVVISVYLESNKSV